MKIIPMPADKGYGFTTFRPIDKDSNPYIDAYRYEQVGIYHNYHFTDSAWIWPESVDFPRDWVIDAFSPNVNKKLHVGHLRQLVLAASLSALLPCKFVSLRGYSQGVMEGAIEDLQQWHWLAGYHPHEVLIDIKLDGSHLPMVDGTGLYEGCKLWAEKPIEGVPVVLKKSDGSTTYAYHELAFKKAVNPTHYVTGVEQIYHFKSLGLADKHYPMGLVMLAEHGKIKSRYHGREAKTLAAQWMLDTLTEQIGEAKEPKLLAWNILAWNLLSHKRTQGVKYDPVEWSKVSAPGLYITYTYARANKALNQPELQSWFGQAGSTEKAEFSELDIALLGMSAYSSYYLQKAIDEFDPCPITHYTLELAKLISKAYDTEKLKGGRNSFIHAFSIATMTLGQMMRTLSMKIVLEI